MVGGSVGRWWVVDRNVFCYSALVGESESGRGVEKPSTLQCVVCSVQYAVFNVQCAVYSVQCAVFSVQCPVSSVQCAVCSVQCAVCSVQCTVCSVHFTVHVCSRVRHRSKPQPPGGLSVSGPIRGARVLYRVSRGTFK